jgi:hypothetical protein
VLVMGSGCSQESKEGVKLITCGVSLAKEYFVSSAVKSCKVGELHK